MAYAVACGGWQCTTPFARERLVDFEVQEDLARSRRGSRQLVALEVDHADEVGGEVMLAAQRRRAEHLVRAEAVRDVAPVAVHVLAVPELLARRDDLRLDPLRLRRTEERLGGG
jgi:hypothetical protein